MERNDALRALAELAADQAGLVTAAQASAVGVARPTMSRLAASDLLENVGRGVYRVAGAQMPEHLSIRVAWLRLDPAEPAWRRTGLGADDGVVSHSSATVLHDLGDIPATDVEITVPRRHRTREPGVRLLTRTDVSVSDVTRVAGLPVTTVERTIVDLLRDRADGAHVGAVIADAVQRGMADLESLSRRIDGLGSGYGMRDAPARKVLSTLVEMADRRLESDRAREVADVAAFLGYTAGMQSALDALAWQDLRDSVVHEAMLRVMAAFQNAPVLDRLAVSEPAGQDSAKESAVPAGLLDAVRNSPVLHKIFVSNPGTAEAIRSVADTDSAQASMSRHLLAAVLAAGEWADEAVARSASHATARRRDPDGDGRRPSGRRRRSSIG